MTNHILGFTLFGYGNCGVIQVFFCCSGMFLYALDGESD